MPADRPPVTLRLGTRADVPVIMQVWAVAHQARRGRSTEPAHQARVRGYFTKPDAFWLVAEAGAAPVGMALAMAALADDGAGPPLPGRCHVSAVVVHPDWWGQGVAGWVLDTLLDTAAERGYRTAQLWTQADNERALRLYAGRGFAATGRSAVIDGERSVQLARE